MKIQATEVQGLMHRTNNRQQNLLQKTERTDKETSPDAFGTEKLNKVKFDAVRNYKTI